MIRLEGICRTFEVGSESVHALVDVDEHIQDGEHVALMGPSGSGKSTLLHILGCLDRPTQGSYQLDGKEVANLSDRELTEIRRHQIGFLFQFFHLVPRLTAAENVDLPMLFAGVTRGERRRRVAEALEAMGLTDRATHRPDQLSGGQRQRTALARAVVMRPRLILADEPTGNLDTASGRQVLDFLQKLHREGMTLVVVTHDPAVARRAQRVLRMVDGRIVQRFPGEEVERHLGVLAATQSEIAEEGEP